MHCSFLLLASWYISIVFVLQCLQRELDGDMEQRAESWCAFLECVTAVDRQKYLFLISHSNWELVSALILLCLSFQTYRLQCEFKHFCNGGGLFKPTDYHSLHWNIFTLHLMFCLDINRKWVEMNEVNKIKYQHKHKDLLSTLIVLIPLIPFLLCQIITLLCRGYPIAGGGRKGEMAGAVSQREHADRGSRCLHHHHHLKRPVVRALPAFLIGLVKLFMSGLQHHHPPPFTVTDNFPFFINFMSFDIIFNPLTSPAASTYFLVCLLQFWYCLSSWTLSLSEGIAMISLSFHSFFEQSSKKILTPCTLSPESFNSFA